MTLLNEGLPWVVGVFVGGWVWLLSGLGIVVCLEFVGGFDDEWIADGAGGLFDVVDELLEFGSAEVDGVGAAVEYSSEEASFEGLEAEYSFFDGTLADEVEDGDGLFLTEAVDAGDALFEECGVPGLVHDEDAGGELEVESDSAGVGGEEDAAVGV